MKKTLFFIVGLLCIFPQLASAQSSKVIESRTIKSSILQREMKYSVYLPAGYDESDRSYPVFYLLHGYGDDHTGWVQFGQVQYIADMAISSGKASPMIIVMPDGSEYYPGYFNMWNGNYNYEDYFFKEFIPTIEKEYRVRSERRYRAIGGLSMGGAGTIIYTMHHPEMFGAAAPLSSAIGDWIEGRMKGSTDNLKSMSAKQIAEKLGEVQPAKILENATEDQRKMISGMDWYISCGDDDYFSVANSELHLLFVKEKVQHEFRIKDGRHSWSYWRMELPEVLSYISLTFSQH